MEFVSTPHPHFIPGYTGYCPQYRFSIGDSYGITTHKLLMDPNVSHAENLVLADKKAHHYQISHPDQTDIDLVEGRRKTVDAIFEHPLIPGYEGFVPLKKKQLGQRFTVQATEGLAEFERVQKIYRDEFKDLESMVEKTDSKASNEPLDKEKLKKMAESPFKIPLVEMKPECASLLRTLPVENVKERPERKVRAPDFLNDDEPPTKSYKNDVPFGCECFGKNFKEMKESQICDFVSNYRKRLSTEWAPTGIITPDPPFIVQPCQIYHRHVGQMPNYTGHIPGAIFRYGKTYGNDSRDAKRWLRGDFRV